MTGTIAAIDRLPTISFNVTFLRRERSMTGCSIGCMNIAEFLQQ
jgi:hypothetical protein